MPELPEVEHVVRSLNTVLSGRSIVAAKLLRDRLAPETTRVAFSRKLKNSTINFVHRRGKHILFDLNVGRTLITHLRMTGSFSVLTTDAPDPKFTHAIFFLDNDSRLVFSDQRHFGLMKIVETGRLFEAPELKKLAPEPFSEEFSIGYVREILSRSKRPIKEFLLDQTKFCGLGNIYAVESLFLAGVDPRIGANRVSAKKAAKIHQAARQVLKEAIEYSESLDADARDLERSYFGDAGWRVYDREGQICGVCDSVIKRIKQGGRSTFYCSKCQRKR